MTPSHPAQTHPAQTHPAQTHPAKTHPAKTAVVVPAFNAEPYLEATLRSIQNQSIAHWECIVVDDGSTDDTAEIAQAVVDVDSRFQLIRQENAGTPIARNVGLAAAGDDVEYLAFVDGDDVWLPDTLQTLLDALAETSSAVGSYGFAEYMDSDGTPFARGIHPARQRDRRRMGRFDLTAVPPGDPYTWSGLIVSGTLFPSAVVLHVRSVVEAVGRFDPDLRQVQDWDLYLRMSRQGPFVPVDKQVAWYRQHDANVTSGTERVAFYSLWVRRKLWRSVANDRAQRKELARTWRRLLARWIVRSVIAGAKAVARGRVRDAREALAALVRFTGLLLLGHPAEPDRRTAHLVAQFVSDGPSTTAPQSHSAL